MTRRELVSAGARSVMSDVCGLKEGERVLVISDAGRSPAIAEALSAAAAEAGAESVIALIEPPSPGAATLPAAVAAAALSSDLILGPTSGSIYYTDGIQNACRGEGSARFLALTECLEETIASPGLQVDFARLRPIIDEVRQVFEGGEQITIATPGGTAISAEIADRPAYGVYGDCSRPGEMSAIPNLEVWVAPIEASVNGRIVVDASASGGIGVIEADPIELEVVDGRVTGIAGGADAEALQRRLEQAEHPGVYQIAEIGLGLNPGCRITGAIIEDEGAYGTVHLAVGSNVHFGGENAAPIHIDLVQRTPTVAIDGVSISSEGELASADQAAILRAEAESASHSPLAAEG